MLELYQAEGCPYCGNVREKLTALGVSYVVHNPRTAGGDVRNERTYDELVKTGGEDQIPFLVDTDRGASLYESADITEYLDRHYGRTKVAQ